MLKVFKMEFENTSKILEFKLFNVYINKPLSHISFQHKNKVYMHFNYTVTVILYM